TGPSWNRCPACTFFASASGQPPKVQWHFLLLLYPQKHDPCDSTHFGNHSIYSREHSRGTGSSHWKKIKCLLPLRNANAHRPSHFLSLQDNTPLQTALFHYVPD